MCEISSSLKLCSCSKKEIEELDHYWLLLRFKKSKNEIQAIGEIILPDLDLATYMQNEETLLELLNSGNCFDFDLQAKENDMLELHFKIESGTTKSIGQEHLTYTFINQGSKWLSESNDPFDLNYKTIQQGKIIHPFQ